MQCFHDILIEIGIEVLKSTIISPYIISCPSVDGYLVVIDVKPAIFIFIIIEVVVVVRNAVQERVLKFSCDYLSALSSQFEKETSAMLHQLSLGDMAYLHIRNTDGEGSIKETAFHYCNMEGDQIKCF